jgi:hypothetical protein
MSSGFPAVLPMSLSFRLFGLGVWQGRLPGVLFMLASLGLLYYLARRLYDPQVAKIALIVLLLMSPSFNVHLGIHPATVGRQALGEMPTLFYLLAGYVCFLLSWERPLSLMPLTCFFWGLMLLTKLQVVPFWIVSLLFPIAIATFRHSWKTVTWLCLALFGTFISSLILGHLAKLFLGSSAMPVVAVEGLYSMTALVPDWPARKFALLIILSFGLPTLVGLCYVTWKYLKSCMNITPVDNLYTMRLSLLTLAVSWFLWYALLSAGWVRYLFPVTFISSIFVAVTIHRLTDNFNHSPISKIILYRIRGKLWNRQSLGGLLALLLVIIWTILTIFGFYVFYIVFPSTSAQITANYINTKTKVDALIETYDAELFFLLNRRYHYPPDQLHVYLTYQSWLDRRHVNINYDPLTTNPDYLVVGPFSRMWKIYGEIIQGNEFIRLMVIGDYTIYERKR